MSSVRLISPKLLYEYIVLDYKAIKMKLLRKNTTIDDFNFTTKFKMTTVAEFLPSLHTCFADQMEDLLYSQFHKSAVNTLRTFHE